MGQVSSDFSWFTTGKARCYCVMFPGAAGKMSAKTTQSEARWEPDRGEGRKNKAKTLSG